MQLAALCKQVNRRRIGAGSVRFRGTVLLSFLLISVATSLYGAEATDRELTLVVMDPLSKPLACDCVEGYAQREYELLQRYLAKQLRLKVRVVWNESLVEAMKETGGKADLVIGKHSVVLFDAKKQDLALTPIAQLTGRLGKVSQRGLIVVRSEDEATSIKDLNGYRVFFGPPEAEEKNAAPKQAFSSAEVELADDCRTFGACSEAAVALLKLPTDVKAAAVISSYAEPLLEGCGSVKKGDLRVVAQTKEVPFVTAFVSADLDKTLQQKVTEALLLVNAQADLMIGLETLLGFVPWTEAANSREQSKAVTVAEAVSKKN